MDAADCIWGMTMTKQYGVYGVHIEPRRQRIFDEVKEKAQNCKDIAQLCAAIYPWIYDITREFRENYDGSRSADSYFNEVNDFKRALAIYISGVPFMNSTCRKFISISAAAEYAINQAVEFDIWLVHASLSDGVEMSAIMANFVKDL